MENKEEESKIYLKITTPKGLLYGGSARSVSSFNKKGKFDVLISHINYVTKIEKQVEIITTEGELKVFPVESGVLRAVENVVDVYLGI
ncbi:hypothetical protein KA001_03435 [Patescibacteria group bacterium]|nr:hypothetical protein [Patescibacteria group bacterium]